MKKGVKIALALVAVAIAGYVVMIAKTYYENTYVGRDYYLQVPADQSTTIDEWQDGGGKYTIRGKQYKFTAFNENGEEKIVEFNIMDNIKPIEKESQLLQPNAYVKVSASKNRVINWKIVEEQMVPTSILEYIKTNH